MITRLIIIIMVSFSLSASSARSKKSVIAQPSEKFLIITADDYGASQNINEGIRLAAQNGVITAISSLTNFPESINSLKSISQEYQDIGIGVHLNITTGKPLSNPTLVPSLVNSDGNFYPLSDLLVQLRKISLSELKTELRAQIKILSDHGIRIDHLSDQHGILSLYPPFFTIVIELASEYNLPVRSPMIASMKYPDIFPHSYMKEEGFRIMKSFLIANPGIALTYILDFQLKEINKRAAKLDSAGIAHPDLLVDYFYGNPTSSNLNYILENLPTGINELVLHLGTSERPGEVPTGINKDYFVSRELELMIVCGFSLNTFLQSLNIRKTGYSEIRQLRVK